MGGRAPAGATVGLYYDSPRAVESGDFLRTPTGRTYLIESVRIQGRGLHVGRQHLRATVMEAGHVPEPDARVLPIYWYGRSRGSA